MKQLPAGFRGVVHHSIDACGVFALVFLGDTSDRQERVGRGSNQQFLEVFDRPPCLVRGGAIETLLQASSMPFHGVPVDVGPRGGGVVFSPFSENSPSHISKDTDVARFLSRKDHTEVCTLSGWVSPPRRPSPPYYRAAFAFSVLSYPLLHPPSLRSGYHGRGEHRAYPGVDEEECGPVRLESLPRWAFGCRHPQSLEVILPTYPFGDGLSASLAMSLHEVLR